MLTISLMLAFVPSSIRCGRCSADCGVFQRRLHLWNAYSPKARPLRRRISAAAGNSPSERRRKSYGAPPNNFAAAEYFSDFGGGRVILDPGIT